MLKDKNIEYSLKFKQLAKAPAFNLVTNTCRLCLTVKYFIMFKAKGANINSRSEFYSACRHKQKLLLCNRAIILLHLPNPLLSYVYTCLGIVIVACTPKFLIPIKFSEECRPLYETACKKIYGIKVNLVTSDI